MKQILIVMLIAVTTASAQMKVTAVEKLALPTDQDWSNPVFSPDGGAIYFTTTTYDGIWKYARAENAVTEITLDPASGNGFTISSDGSQIAYRRTSYDQQTHERTQDAIVVNAVTLSKRVAASGADVAAPAFARNELVYTVAGTTHVPALAKSAAPEVDVLGIENTKIAILNNGSKVLLDPLGGGSYIWPSLSPDKQKIAAYDLRRGTFICDLNGTVLASFGRRDAPVWTRDGKWLVYMNDVDDGNKILHSEICAVSADGKQTLQLTSTPDVLEMNPSCSPTENKIVCSANGALYVISYEETK
jgi:Tol biopolymer transport system component